MKSTVKVAAMAVAAFFLLTASSCDPTIVYRTTLLAPGDNLLVDCDIHAPPPKQVYKAAGESDTREEAADVREMLLTTTIVTQYKDLGVCNGRWKALRDWKARQEQLQKEADEKSQKGK
jgi:hypothetical protein